MVQDSRQQTEYSDKLEAGELFASRYRIERPLGEGDRKRTYLAEDLKVGDRLVALSVVKPHAADLDPDGTRREANLLSRVGSHPNLVAFHDFDAEGPTQYLVFEYLGGGTLADLIERTTLEGRDVDSDTILRYGRQLTRALSHMHSAGIIHRDLSPHNVWLDSRQEAHLGDFDSAIVLGQADDLRPLTTDSYVSPEERRGDQVDQRSDLYSLGCVLICLAMGHLHVDEPRSLSERRPDLPLLLRQLLVRLVASSPEDRPSDAEEVLRRLDEVRRGRTVQAVIAAGEGPQVEFKSSLRFPRNLPPGMPKGDRQKAIDSTAPKLEKAVLKTIAAFLNTQGGTLLVGVHDDGSVVGIEDDLQTFEPRRRDLDGWQLRLRERVSICLGSDAWTSLRLRLEALDNSTVAQIECTPRAQPTWLTIDGQEEFYIRAASASEALRPSLAAQYIKEHWPS